MYPCNTKNHTVVGFVHTANGTGVVAVFNVSKSVIGGKCKVSEM